MQEIDKIEKEIENKRGHIKTENVIFSIGEIINLYLSKDLNMNPEFQRFFRWTNEQKSRLIESVFLGLPIPSFFVYEDKNNVWEVLDGLQRISSILEYTGELNDSDGNSRPPLKLENLQYLNTLEGTTWNDISDKLKRGFKKSTLPFIVMKNETTEIKKYQLFQRLNRGGTSLTEAEVRNCIILMENNGKKLMEAIDEMVSYDNFQKSLYISDKKKAEKFDFDLVIRYLCFKHFNSNELSNVENVNDYLNNKISLLATQELNYEEDIIEFKKIFKAVYEQLQDKGFSRYYPDENKFKGQFLMAQYEAVIYGVLKTNNLNNLRNKLIKLSLNDTYKEYSIGGIAAKSRWNKILELAKTIFENE